MARDSTVDADDAGAGQHAHGSPVPGVLVILDAGRPAAVPLALPPRGLELGRGLPDGLFADDEQVSRAHASVKLEGDAAVVSDLGSRNGSFLDGARLERAQKRIPPALLRMGRSLLWIVPDVRPFALGAHAPSAAREQGPVLGGLLSRAFGEIALAAKAGDSVLIAGESGAGKELAARAFHEAYGEGNAPFVAVNCAAIPEGLAERLLFGSKRGAYSGALDADGYLQQADGGTLFLDEIADLDPLVQAKVLRVLETREVMTLGATRPRPLKLRICAASHKDLREEVGAGRFRADLYYRIGRPLVRIPPLRERIDEIPWLAQRALQAIDRGLAPSATLIERCALLPWPGNVRELQHELRRAGHAAQQESVQLVLPEHLAADAGTALASESSVARAVDVDDAAIAQALAEHDGNVTAAARALGLHRNQLRRLLAKR
ncbi:MAG TPA: sigma 54-interacting transcriptional regulator [Polyangiales bacterium]|nr:sigma 54-interacting transcriptional regulator [Polyangiales bacterium]